MKEKQAINRHIAECKHKINNIQNFVENNQNADIKVCTDNIFVLEVVIKALKEVQQYRAIDTVEECRTAAEKMKPRK